MRVLTFSLPRAIMLVPCEATAIISITIFENSRKQTKENCFKASAKRQAKDKVF